MKANCWMSKNRVEVQEVPDPKTLNQRDAIIRITSTAICGSDLHLYDGFVPSMMKGDILGHEFMGEVIEPGREVKNLRVGDRVVVPFPIACGNCWSCQQELYSLCENSNPNAWMAEKMWGHSPSGSFGYSHMLGGYAGGQAQYARVPFADVGPIKIPDELEDEQVLFLSDIFPTGYMAAEACNIQPGDTMAIWGCGPVAQFAIKSAYLLGAERVIAIDRFDYRLRMAHEKAGAETLDYERVNVLEALKEMPGRRGPDACIEAVGMEAHGAGIEFAYDRVKQAMMLETDRPIALREAIQACRNGGTVSMPGVEAHRTAVEQAQLSEKPAEYQEITLADLRVLSQRRLLAMDETGWSLTHYYRQLNFMDNLIEKAIAAETVLHRQSAISDQFNVSTGDWSLTTAYTVPAAGRPCGACMARTRKARISSRTPKVIA